MSSKPAALEQFVYPGRFLIVGKDEGKYVILYGVTGRNPSSKAKRYVYEQTKTPPGSGVVRVQATDDTMAKGDLSLLDYTAFRCVPFAVVAGNGRQVERVSLEKKPALQCLKDGLQDEVYEHDKYCTPRITACLTLRGGAVTAALHRIMAAEDSDAVVRDLWDVPLVDGQALFLPTYAGPNVRPTPSFRAEPVQIPFTYGSASEACNAVYDWFAPQENEENLLVSIVSGYFEEDMVAKQMSIINVADAL